MLKNTDRKFIEHNNIISKRYEKLTSKLTGKQLLDKQINKQNIKYIHMKNFINKFNVI